MIDNICLNIFDAWNILLTYEYHVSFTFYIGEKAMNTQTVDFLELTLNLCLVYYNLSDRIYKVTHGILVCMCNLVCDFQLDI